MAKTSHQTAFSVTNCICYDQRVHKMARTVQGFGTEITIIGRKRGLCCEQNTVPWKTHRFRMIFNKGFLFYKFYNIRLFFYLLFNRFDLLVANDLDTLLPNFLVSRLKRIPLVYDSHEYFTGAPELQNRPFVRGVWKTIERYIFPKLKFLITVSDPIAEKYFNEYGKRPVTIRNCAPRSEHIKPFTRSELAIDAGHMILILQGAGININRGGEELIDTMSQLENITLLIIGSGDVFNKLKTRAGENGVSGKVRFIPAISWKEMMRYTKSADAGLSLDKNTNLNYRFSLPNKLFDYISAGIPVIAGDLPEVAKIITENSCGVIIPEITPDEIGQAIKLLDSNRDLLSELKQNAKRASEKINWDIESKKVYEVYKVVINQ